MARKTKADLAAAAAAEADAAAHAAALAAQNENLTVGTIEAPRPINFDLNQFITLRGTVSL